MKTVKSIFVALALILSTSITAATEPAADPNVLIEASNEIANLLGTPYFDVEEEISASVSLVVNSAGELVVLNVESENDQVESYVKSRLNYHKIKTQLDKGYEYELPLKITSN